MIKLISRESAPGLSFAACSAPLELRGRAGRGQWPNFRPSGSKNSLDKGVLISFFRIEETFIRLQIEGVWRERDPIMHFQSFQEGKTLLVIHIEIALKLRLWIDARIPLHFDVAVNDFSEFVE